MRNVRHALIIVAVALLTGCASITGSKNQPVSVQTYEKGKQVVGASCTLVNDKGTWFVATPGSIVIQKSYQDLAVTCNKDDHNPGSAIFRSASNGGVWGNILAGGIIGYAVDSSSGAGFDYPSLLSVELGVHQALPPPREGEESKTNADAAHGETKNN